MTVSVHLKYKSHVEGLKCVWFDKEYKAWTEKCNQFENILKILHRRTDLIVGFWQKLSKYCIKGLFGRSVVVRVSSQILSPYMFEMIVYI